MGSNVAKSSIFPIPEKVTDATFETDPGENIRRGEIINEHARAIVRKH